MPSKILQNKHNYDFIFLEKNIIIFLLIYLYATGLTFSVSHIILKSRQRKSGFVLGRIKWFIISLSFDIEVQLRYSSSTDFFNNCLFSSGWLFCTKNSFKADGKQAKECEAQECGVFCIITLSSSLHQGCNSSPMHGNEKFYSEYSNMNGICRRTQSSHVHWTCHR